MNDAVHIACCFDREMELPFLVLANSIKRHLSGNRRVILHALHSDPLAHDPVFSQNLESSTFEIAFQPVENPYDISLATNFNSTAQFIRLMLPSLLPDVSRVVYLDTDLFLARDIAPLFDIDLCGSALAAMPDYFLTGGYPNKGWLFQMKNQSVPVPQYITEVVGLADWTSYFNSGVMVLDLDQFRARDFQAAFDRYLETSQGRRMHNEQDALNHVIDGAYVRLDPRWNMNAARTDDIFEGSDAGLARVRSLWNSDPWIIHYGGYGKPWRPETQGTPWDEWFWREAAESAFFPLLVETYLRECGRAGYTRLHSAWPLLTVGKPSLDRSHFLAHAQKFQHLPAVASATMRLLDEIDSTAATNHREPHRLSPQLFRHNHGISGNNGDTLLFDLAGASGHLVYGPYLWYPRAHYESIFEFDLSPDAIGDAPRLVIEAADTSGRYLAQRDVAVTPAPPADSRALHFIAPGREWTLEFRIFAAGFSIGTLRFSGVTLHGDGVGRADS